MAKQPWPGGPDDVSVAELAESLMITTAGARNLLRKKYGELPSRQSYEWRVPHADAHQIRLDRTLRRLRAGAQLDEFEIEFLTSGWHGVQLDADDYRLATEAEEQARDRSDATGTWFADHDGTLPADGPPLKADNAPRRGASLFDHASLVAEAEAILSTPRTAAIIEPSRLERAVKVLGLPGHEAGFDPKLAATQIMRERELTRRFDIVWNAVTALYRCLAEAIKQWQAFADERACFRLEIPELGYARGLTPEEMAPRLGNLAGWARAAGETDEAFARYDYSRADYEDPTEVYTNFPALMEAGTEYEFCEAAVNTLAAQGLFRGPCRNCGLERWPVKWQAPGTKAGRKPLSETLCPACELGHIRKIKALDQRALRRRNSSGKPSGRPKKNP